MTVRPTSGVTVEEERRGIWQVLREVFTALREAPAVAIAVGPGAQARVGTERAVEEAHPVPSVAPAVELAAPAAAAPPVAPVAAPAVAAPAPPTNLYFYTNTGRRFHRARRCRGLRHALEVHGPVPQTALDANLTPCRVCAA